MSTTTDRAELLARLNDALPKVGESESAWCCIQGFDLRAVIDALTPAQPVAPQEQPVAWLVEYGAVSLPAGDPSRITDYAVFDNKTDAEAFAAGCEFDSKVGAVGWLNGIEGPKG